MEPPDRLRLDFKKEMVFIRKRNKEFLVRVTEEEYNQIKKCIEESGRTTQEYLRAAAQGLKLTSSDVLTKLIELNTQMMEINNKLDAILGSVDQMFYWGDVYQDFPAQQELIELKQEVKKIRKECQSIWELIRWSVADLRR